jgi:phage terminase large subunit-like protein
VLELRPEIASALEDFRQEGSLEIVPVPEDHEQLGAIVEKICCPDCLPEKNAIGLDPNNAAGVVSALKNAGVTEEQIRRLKQGSGLSSGMYGLERKLSDGTLTHAGQLLMAWVVGNAKVEVARDGGKMITKQVSGSRKSIR